MGSYGREQPLLLGFNQIHKTTGETLEDDRLLMNLAMKSTQGGVFNIWRRHQTILIVKYTYSLILV